jgi:hypothetical protein
MHFRDGDHHVSPIVVHRHDIAGTKVRMQHVHAFVLQVLLVMYWVDFEYVAQTVELPPVEHDIPEGCQRWLLRLASVITRQ